MTANTPAPGIHHHDPSQRASAMTTRSATQAATKVPPSWSHPPKTASKYPISETPWRRSHQSAASENGSCVSQTIASPTIPRSIPVPIGPAADSRMNRVPRFAYTKSVSRAAI